MSETAVVRDAMDSRARLRADRWYVLFVLTCVYALNIADRFVVSTLIEPIKAEFALNDGAVGLLTGAALAIFYVSAGIPLGLLADRRSRKRTHRRLFEHFSLLMRQTEERVHP